MDRLIRFGIENRILAFALGLLVAAAGLYSFQQLPVDAFPDVSPNLVQIFTVTEGLSPEDVEKYVTFPIETTMNGLPGLENVRSVSNFGLSVVNVYFEDDVDIYFARQLVNERLQEARESIPQGFGEPTMGPISTGMGLVLFYYLEDTTGHYSLTRMRTIQDWLVKNHLLTVPGVTEVLGIGGYEKQYQVRVHPESLVRYNVTIADVIDRIRDNNLNVGAQFIERNAEEYIVRSVGLASDVDDLKHVVIKTNDGTPVFLHELADIHTGGAIRRGVQTRNGVEEVVAGMVIKLFGTNSSTVIERVESKLAELSAVLPPGIRLVPYYEQKTIVEECVATVTTALVQGIALVALVLIVFMGAVRPSLIVALSIPFSALFALFWMGYFGISANLMSLGGLAIAIGMMVDGTIVLVENVDRVLRERHLTESRTQLVARACAEVAKPITFAISIIIIVFLPLLTLQGVEGKTFRPMAYTIALAMAGSLVFTLLLAPALSDLLMRPPTGHGAEGDHESWLTRWLMKAYRPIAWFFIRHRILAVGLALAFLAVGAATFPRLGSEFTPRLREGTLVLRLTMAPSISLRESTRVTQIVERRLMQVPEIRGVVTRIGRGEVGAHTDPVNSAEMYILLVPSEEWRSPNDQDRVEAAIRKDVGSVPGVLTNYTQPIAMTVDELLEGVRAELAIKVFGDDLDVLLASATEISHIIQELPGAADVQVDQLIGTPQLVVHVDRQAVARYGLNVADVQRTIRASIGGEVAGQIFEGTKRFDINVRFAEEYRNTAEAIANVLIAGPTGVRVPLSEVTRIEEIVGPRQITRERNQRFISVQCNVVGRDIGGFVAEAQAEIERKVDLPLGYFTTWGGQFRLQQEANRRLSVVVPITLLVVSLLLYASFGSLKNTILIFLNIPLALVGGIVGLAITGQNFSVPASVGFIALFGIALENGMVLVTYLNQLLADGLDVDEASIRGACRRLRPVLMTAVTTGLGLIPLLFSRGTGSEVQQPLATVVVGGLVTSTILTLLVVPALYKWFSAPPGQAAAEAGDA